MNPQPIVLTGTHARLEPLALGHAEGLYAAGRDDSVWTHLMRPALADADDARAFIAGALDAARDGAQIPFAIVRRADERVAGSTRYLNISPRDRGMEIGWTWLDPEQQRTVINTECKFLLLRHAFETLGCVRVQLKTDLRNERSQRAIERLGAVREGVLRKYQLTRGDRIRDTVMYSILDNEWPGVKARLEEMLRVK